MAKGYSSNESLERIKRVLNGEVISSYNINRYGQEAWDESLSKIAQLVEGSSAGLRAPLETYGHIWAWTGTASITALASTAFTKVTGTFQNYSNYENTTPQPTSDRILVTSSGEVFRIDWSVSFIGSPAISYKFEPYYGGVGIPQAASAATPNTSGTKATAAGFGYQYISGTNVYIDLEVKPSATAWLLPVEASLMLRRVGPRVNAGSNGS
jgi:hypothetical protein